MVLARGEHYQVVAARGLYATRLPTPVVGRDASVDSLRRYTAIEQNAQIRPIIKALRRSTGMNFHPAHRDRTQGAEDRVRRW